MALREMLHGLQLVIQDQDLMHPHPTIQMEVDIFKRDNMDNSYDHIATLVGEYK